MLGRRLQLPRNGIPPPMSDHLIIRHTTEYRYQDPVRFGTHRLMFRPRDSHTLRLLNTNLNINPAPVRIGWTYDVFGNSVAHADFGNQMSSTLSFYSEIGILHYEATQATQLLLKSAERFPFSYTNDEKPDLLAVMAPQIDEGSANVSEWARDVVKSGDGQTLSVIRDMMDKLRNDIVYKRRSTMGTQAPTETLSLRTGTCRDFAWLMIEALRSIGFAARFVSGYIYAPNKVASLGGGATHAWVQVYLPGCGWIEMDPTNGIFGNRDLIRIAVTRNPSQARPLSGSYVGSVGCFLGLTVSVSVANAAQPALAR
jgi:transglutaminase-like putative cysteine protease